MSWWQQFKDFWITDSTKKPAETKDEGIRKAEQFGFNVVRKGRLEEKAHDEDDYEDIMPAFSDDAGPRESNINEYDLYKELEKIKNKISK